MKFAYCIQGSVEDANYIAIIIAMSNEECYELLTNKILLDDNNWLYQEPNNILKLKESFMALIQNAECIKAEDNQQSRVITYSSYEVGSI